MLHLHEDRVQQMQNRCTLSKKMVAQNSDFCAVVNISSFYPPLSHFLSTDKKEAEVYNWVKFNWVYHLV